MRAAKAFTFCCQPCSSGPLSPVTRTLSSATCVLDCSATMVPFPDLGA